MYNEVVKGDMSKPDWDMSILNGHVPIRFGHVPLHSIIV